MFQPIRIEILDIDSYYRKREQFYLQNFYGNKRLIPLIIYTVIGLSLIVGGIASGYDIQMVTSINGEEEVTLNNYGILIGLGCGLILFSILVFLQIKKLRTSTRIISNTNRNRQKKENTSLQFEITDENVFFNSNLNSWNKKWEYYDAFRFKNQFLNLYSNCYHADFPELVLPINSLNEAQMEALTELLKRKLKNFI